MRERGGEETIRFPHNKDYIINEQLSVQEGKAHIYNIVYGHHKVSILLHDTYHKRETY